MIKQPKRFGLHRIKKSNFKENHIGEVLRNLRLEKNWSQCQAATHAKIASPTWHFMEKERAMPHYETLLNIAKAFNIRPVTLLLLAFNKIYLLEREGFIKLSYNGYETDVVFIGEFTEGNYYAIRLMMGRERIHPH
jgi:transcriptional regulator with XRE-family HTH domain